MLTSISVTKCTLTLWFNFNIASDDEESRKLRSLRILVTILHKRTKQSLDPSLRNNPNTTLNANPNDTHRYFRFKPNLTLNDVYQNLAFHLVSCNPRQK